VTTFKLYRIVRGVLIKILLEFPSTELNMGDNVAKFSLTKGFGIELVGIGYPSRKNRLKKRYLHSTQYPFSKPVSRTWYRFSKLVPIPVFDKRYPKLVPSPQNW
jgi:hypothetical protein